MEETDAILKLLVEDRRFSIGTYNFLLETLDCVQAAGVASSILSEAHEEPEENDDVELDEDSMNVEEDDADHITGQQLCRFVVDYAVAQYGRMARTVLAQLGMKTTGDIGDVVYNMIRVGLMTKTQEDSREDFDDVFDLGAELDAAFVFQYEKRKR